MFLIRLLKPTRVLFNVCNFPIYIFISECTLTCLISNLGSSHICLSRESLMAYRLLSHVLTLYIAAVKVCMGCVLLGWCAQSIMFEHVELGVECAVDLLCCCL